MILFFLIFNLIPPSGLKKNLADWSPAGRPSRTRSFLPWLLLVDLKINEFNTDLKLFKHLDDSSTLININSFPRDWDFIVEAHKSINLKINLSKTDFLIHPNKLKLWNTITSVHPSL